jgi:hypothetical protein
VHAEILQDTTPELDVEGSLSCGKTTACLWKELDALVDYPGIWSLITRWTDDSVRTLLRPAFEQLARIRGIGLWWDDKHNYYNLENGSRCFAFGLRTQSQDPEQRYGKIRGLPVSRIYVDQAEQLPADIASELRARLRPDLEAKLRGADYPRQLTFSPNPTNDDHWLAKQFPITNTIKNRRYYAISLFQNRHNLPADFIESMLTEYPPEHPKHLTVILGQRGLNVVGDPVYDTLFDRRLHSHRPIAPREELPLLEAFEVGTHNPVWIACQRTYHGGLVALGGLLGKRLVLEEFLPLVKSYRAEWFPRTRGLKACTAPMGESVRTAGQRYTLLSVLRAAGIEPVWLDAANAPDVQLAMIEHIAGLLKRRTIGREEAFGINADKSRWLLATPDGSIREVPFLAFAFEGGYVWSPHLVSINNKEVRQPFNDDEYANAMRALEHVVANFCAQHRSDAEQEDLEEQRRHAQQTASGPTVAPSSHSWLSY